MKIAYYNPALAQTWGAGIHARELVKAWRALGHEVLELPSTEANACRDAAEPGWSWAGSVGTVVGRDVRRRNCGRRYSERTLVAIEAFGPDVAVVRRIDYDYLADAFLGRLRVPYVAEVNAVAAVERARLNGQGSLPGERSRERRYLERATRVVCAAADIVAEVAELGVTRRDLVVVHNGVDVDMFDPSVLVDREAEAFRVACSGVAGYCATASAVHDFDTLAKAAGRLSQDREGVGFLVIGLDPEYVRERLDQEGVVPDSVFATGRVDHGRVPSLLAATDLLWGAISKDTNFSLKVFEYMAMAKPVCMASEGLEPSPVDDACAGEVVPRGDSEGLARAAARLLADPDAATRTGANGRAWVVANATWTQVAAKMIEGVVS